MNVKKCVIYNSKCPADIDEVDIKNIVTKVSDGRKGFKFFISNKNDDKVKPLCIILPKISEYVKCLDETTGKSFLVKDKEYL